MSISLPIPALSAPALAAPARRLGRALVVEDEALVCEAVMAVLEVEGFEVDGARSAEAALSRIRAGSHDLILSDLRMPGLGGFHLLREVKRIDSALPVVIMTGQADLASSVEALRLEADDFLVKPLVPAELCRVSHRAFEKGRLLRENQRQKATLERLYRVKSEFLANMSHELRTPLTTIIGMTEALGDGLFGDLNRKQKSYVDTVHLSARHLLNLINDILDSSKIEAGKMGLELTEVVAVEIAAIACSVVEGQALTKDIRIERRAVADVTLWADRTRLVQILVNLLSNAVKFSPEGSVVRISGGADSALAWFAVADDGIGIDPEHHEAIFEEFRQVNGGASGKDPGTGLGLALSRALARMHGGEVEVASRAGAGSTFTLRIPKDARAQPPTELNP